MLPSIGNVLEEVAKALHSIVDGPEEDPNDATTRQELLELLKPITVVITEAFLEKPSNALFASQVDEDLQFLIYKTDVNIMTLCEIIHNLREKTINHGRMLDVIAKENGEDSHPRTVKVGEDKNKEELNGYINKLENLAKAFSPMGEPPPEPKIRIIDMNPLSREASFQNVEDDTLPNGGALSEEELQQMMTEIEQDASDAIEAGIPAESLIPQESEDKTDETTE